MMERGGTGRPAEDGARGSAAPRGAAGAEEADPDGGPYTREGPLHTERALFCADRLLPNVPPWRPSAS